MSANDFKQRIQSEAQACMRITNSDLVCKDCVFVIDDTKVLGNTSHCKQYMLKPNNVLLGKECDKYEKK